MPYLFTCPHCQTKTQVEDRYSGQAGQCVTCGAAIQLPQFTSGETQSSGTRKNPNAAGWWIAASVALILLGCLLFAMVRLGGSTMNRLSTSRERTTSIRNLERIAEALNSYAADNGTYPPPATRDRNNAKLHSWRVLILPYLGEEDLYNKFDLNLPWDHRANMAVARSEIPLAYQHPNRGVSSAYYESGYYLITGQGTLFPNTGPLGPDQVSDNLSQTILVTEGTPLVPSGMWTEPVDLDFANIQGKLGTKPGIEPGGLLEDGVAFATVDARGHFVSNVMEPMTFRSLVTCRGGERMRDDTLD
jgi:hypothetical protein